MSRYQVAKAMREVILDDAALAAFKADPSGFLAGRDLTDREREALATGNYPELYAAGAHPFLLNVFAMRQWPAAEIMPRWAAYTKALEGLGYPDFST